jgi:hypothetical protein
MDYVHLQPFDLHVNVEHNVMGPYAFTIVSSNLIDGERDSRERGFHYNHERPYTTAVSFGADIASGCCIHRPNGKLANPPVGTLGC